MKLRTFLKSTALALASLPTTLAASATNRSIRKPKESISTLRGHRSMVEDLLNKEFRPLGNFRTHEEQLDDIEKTPYKTGYVYTIDTKGDHRRTIFDGATLEKVWVVLI